jgi:hypothetical protein
MPPIHKEASRQWRRRIRDILNTEWDPIGLQGYPVDEYEHYAGGVAAMIREGASDVDILSYLQWVQDSCMGLTPRPEHDATRRKVLAAIRDLGPAL